MFDIVEVNIENHQFGLFVTHDLFAVQERYKIQTLLLIL